MRQRNFSGFSSKVINHHTTAEFLSTEPTLSRARLIGSAASLITGLFVFYCSLFYLPAYLNQDDIVRISSHNRVSPSLERTGTPVNWYTPYIDLLRLRRGFFRQGQTIEVEYLLSQPSTLQIEIKRCGGPLIYEIFKCHVVDQISHSESESLQGRLMVKAPVTGFYRMSDNVVAGADTTIQGEADLPDKLSSNPTLRLSAPLEYSVVWRRK